MCYRTDAALKGYGVLGIVSYPHEGRKDAKQLALQRLSATNEWTTVSGAITLPDEVARVHMVLYLQGQGTIWYDDAFFGDATEGAANLLVNGGFEPAASYIDDVAPERPSGKVAFRADFDSASLGKVKQLGPDEFYLDTFEPSKPHASRLWFHFRIDGCKDRELVFRVNVAPYSKAKTSGNGTRLPVMSYDGDHWTGIEDKAWNEDGSVLTFKQRFTQEPAWIASFFPITPEHLSRWIEDHKNSPYVKAGVLGKSNENRPIRIVTITDPGVPEADKRVLLFTTLQHDMETTGAMTLEGICRFFLTEDPRADRLRRAFVLYVFPMMDPDGIAKGLLYWPIGNMNRQWGLGTTPETTCVEKFVQELASRGRKVDLFMDFHGYCAPTRSTYLMTFGKELVGETCQQETMRLTAAIRPRLTGQWDPPRFWHKPVEPVSGIASDLQTLCCGWMKLEAQARLSLTAEINGEGECSQEGYFAWGQAIAEGIADYFGLGGK